MTKRKIQYWVIPPEADAEFVAAMEAVLDTYEKPYDSDHPVLCMDEQPVQLIQEARRPLPATRRHAKRMDYEYERAGTASIFLFTEPLGGCARRRLGPRGQSWTGRWKWLACWKDAIAIVPRCPWCAITSTRTRSARSMRRFGRRGLGSWSGKFASVTRRSTAVG